MYSSNQKRQNQQQPKKFQSQQQQHKQLDNFQNSTNIDQLKQEFIDNQRLLNNFDQKSNISKNSKKSTKSKKNQKKNFQNQEFTYVPKQSLNPQTNTLQRQMNQPKNKFTVPDSLSQASNNSKSSVGSTKSFNSNVSKSFQKKQFKNQSKDLKSNIKKDTHTVIPGLTKMMSKIPRYEELFKPIQQQTHNYRFRIKKEVPSTMIDPFTTIFTQLLSSKQFDIVETQENAIIFDCASRCMIIQQLLSSCKKDFPEGQKVSELFSMTAHQIDGLTALIHTLGDIQDENGIGMFSGPQATIFNQLTYIIHKISDQSTKKNNDQSPKFKKLIDLIYQIEGIVKPIDEQSNLTAFSQVFWTNIINIDSSIRFLSQSKKMLPQVQNLVNDLIFDFKMYYQLQWKDGGGSTDTFDFIIDNEGKETSHRLYLDPINSDNYANRHGVYTTFLETQKLAGVVTEGDLQLWKASLSFFDKLVHNTKITETLKKEFNTKIYSIDDYTWKKIVQIIELILDVYIEQVQPQVLLFFDSKKFCTTQLGNACQLVRYNRQKQQGTSDLCVGVGDFKLGTMIDYNLHTEIEQMYSINSQNLNPSQVFSDSVKNSFRAVNF